MLLHQTLTQAVQTAPDKTALVAEGQRLSYAQIDTQSTRLAAALQARGVQRGDRVATFLDNSVAAVVSIFAVLKCGAAIVPINSLTKADKVAYVLHDAQACTLIAHDALRAHFEAAALQLPGLHTCVVVGGEGALPAHARFLSYDALPEGTWVEPATIDQDLASITYTSGSTGSPKGVMLTHLNMLSAVRSTSTSLALGASDVILCALPLAFNYGIDQVLMGVLNGATLVLEHSFAFPVKLLETMTRERVTVFPGVPTMFALLLSLKTLNEHPLPHLRKITNAAAALSEEHIRLLRQQFPQALLYSMYGQTECKRVTYLPPEQLDIRPTSVGRGMPNEEVWLVDEGGRRLPHGSTGELVIRGSHVMRGYWGQPELTAERLKPGPLAGEVVLHSGDIFRTDSEGWLYFVARRDDIIKTRGEKVSPREVEDQLYKLEAVLEAAVVGVPDPVLGQAVKAFIALKPGTQLTEREVIRHCQAQLESFMAPKYVVFVTALPKTDSGKIKKTGLQ